MDMFEWKELCVCQVMDVIDQGLNPTLGTGNVAYVTYNDEYIMDVCEACREH